MMIDYRLGGWVQNGQNIDYVILEQPLKWLNEMQHEILGQRIIHFVNHFGKQWDINNDLLHLKLHFIILFRKDRDFLSLGSRKNS